MTINTRWKNQEAAITFLDRFNRGLPQEGLPPVHELDPKTLQCTHSGQVMLDYRDAKPLMEFIREYYVQHREASRTGLRQLYYSPLYPRINAWTVARYEGRVPRQDEILWQATGSSQWDKVTINRYLLHHSGNLTLPLLWVHNTSDHGHAAVLWLGENGKLSAPSWPIIQPLLNNQYDILSIDPRGLGETKMPYQAVSGDDPALGKLDFAQAYLNPLSGVLANYVYNSLLTGRPYFLEVLEDIEIATRFFHQTLRSRK